MARVKDDVPSYAKAGVLYEALSKLKDLTAEMMFFNQRHPGHIKPKNARRRYSSLMRILDNAIISEREKANQEEQLRADKRAMERITGQGTKPAASAPQAQPQTGAHSSTKTQGNGSNTGKGQGKGQKCDGDMLGGMARGIPSLAAVKAGARVQVRASFV